MTRAQAYFRIWNKHGQQLHVAWENGAYSIFDNSNPERVKLFDFHSGEAIEEASASYSVLTQSLDTVDRKFWAAMRPSIDKKSRISLQHLAQKTLLKFYRGDWIAYDGMKDTPYDILKFGRFGGVELRSNKDNTGTWYPSGKRCTLSTLKMGHVCNSNPSAVDSSSSFTKQRAHSMPIQTKSYPPHR